MTVQWAAITPPAAITLPTDEIGGLPLHPIVVHVALVLVPLASLGLIVMGSSGARSKRYGPAVGFVAAVGALGAWAAYATGAGLQQRLGPVATRHFQYGELLPWAALVVLGMVVLLGLMDRQGGGRRNAVGGLVAIAGILVGLAATVLAVLTGYTGTQLVWG